jgi:hypothetical protein
MLDTLKGIALIATCIAAMAGLRTLPDVKLDRLPRMADFAIWATACESALGSAGILMKAYCRNRDDAVEALIEADPVANALPRFIATRTAWTGTVTDLLRELCEKVDEAVRKDRHWPASAKALSGRLRRAAPCLRKIGIEIERDRDKSRKRSRNIYITVKPENAPPAASEPSTSSAKQDEAKAGKDFPAKIQAERADDPVDDTDIKALATVRNSTLKTNGRTNTDDADAKIPPFSFTEEDERELSEALDFLRSEGVLS